MESRNDKHAENGIPPKTTFSGGINKTAFSRGYKLLKIVIWGGKLSFLWWQIVYEFLKV